AAQEGSRSHRHLIEGCHAGGSVCWIGSHARLICGHYAADRIGRRRSPGTITRVVERPPRPDIPPRREGGGPWMAKEVQPTTENSAEHCTRRGENSGEPRG